MSIICLVEGHGDKSAAPVLVRRLAPGENVTSRRISAGKFFAGDWSEVEVAARRSRGSGLLLILDTDCDADRCPKAFAATTQLQLCRRVGTRARLVLAECEFETWFIEAAESLGGHRGLPGNLRRPAAPLAIRGAKEWLSGQMPHGYSPTLDQPSLAAVFDIEAARRNSRSFRKFCEAVAYLTA